MSTRKIIATLIGIASLFLIVGCEGNGNRSRSASEGTTTGRENWPDRLVFAAVPTEDQEVISRRYDMFLEYLEERVGIPVDIFFPTSYTATIEAFRGGNADIARFGPFAYILANERANSEMFAVAARPGLPTTYYAAFITLDDSGIEDVQDLRGRSWAFVDPASASGHLFPRAELVNALGISNDEIESFFGAVNFSGSHQASVSAVLNGDVDAAAISSGGGFRSLEGPLSGHPNASRVVVFHRTGDIPGTGYALRGELPADLRAAIRGAFYDAVNYPELADFFDEVGAAGYLRQSDSDYDIIRQTAAAIGMSPEELF